MKYFLFFTTILLSLFLVSCREESGPYEETTKTYPLANFDRLDMGSAFRIEVRKGTAFQVEVRGNRRDIDDLGLNVRNNTLEIQYDRNRQRNRRYDMFITVTMPTVRAVSFSGASRSTITGFTDLRELSIGLSGASRSTALVNATSLSADLSGASDLVVTGTGNQLSGSLSGASKMEAYDFPVNQADLDLSGASTARIRVNDALTVKASGGSTVRYKGTPRVNSSVSGASSISQE
ncbi:MAG TPA: head GIN domain-containing protein [Spirosoma sp.]|nr:head GIN domain-containing protein [Spirosoma sp.]